MNGCSDRVAGAGCFGASLMLQPQLVGDCMAAIAEASGGLPVNVKCRLGVDEVRGAGLFCRACPSSDGQRGTSQWLACPLLVSGFNHLAVAPSVWVTACALHVQCCCCSLAFLRLLPILLPMVSAAASDSARRMHSPSSSQRGISSRLPPQRTTTALLHPFTQPPSTPTTGLSYGSRVIA